MDGYLHFLPWRRGTLPRRRAACLNLGCVWECRESVHFVIHRLGIFGLRIAIRFRMLRVLTHATYLAESTLGCTRLGRLGTDGSSIQEALEAQIHFRRYDRMMVLTARIRFEWCVCGGVHTGQCVDCTKKQARKWVCVRCHCLDNAAIVLFTPSTQMHPC